jgi:hypothetical protein
MSKRIGGDLIINNRGSNIVSPKKSRGGSQYSSYLKFQKGGDSCQDKLQGGGSKKITIGRRKSAGGKIRPCKNGSKKKKDEPGEIPILDVQFVKKEEPKKEVKKEPQKEVKKEDKRRSSQKRVSRVNRGQRVSRVSRVSRANRAKANRVSRAKGVSRVNRVNRGGGSLKKEKKGRKVSVSTARKLGKRETHKMQKKIKEIQNKSTNDMINELKKEGIEVSGKSKTILKDIYMYQKMCGINIRRE